MFLHCSGSGSPTVVMDAGAGVESSTWKRVQDLVAPSYRVCRYDRAGLGRSDNRPQAHASSDLIVRELSILLEDADVTPPYILVGHSFGGMNIRLFAHRYPDAVVGAVFVDAAHESLIPLLGFTGVPEGRSTLDLVASARELASVRSLYVPAVVLTHGYPLRGFRRVVERRWLEFQRALTRLSHDSALILALKSGHRIQEDQPDLVAEAIFQVIAAGTTATALENCARIWEVLDGRCLD